MSRKDPKKRFDVHRTLPTRHHQSNQTASHRQRVAVDELAAETPRHKWRKPVMIALAILLAAFIFITTWDAINLSRASNQLFGSGNIFSLLGYGELNGAERGRVNVLLVGYSADDPGHPGAKLTDSIILLSMDTKKHSGYMLSIPRDLYVNIPDHGYGKINEAYNDGGIKLLSSIVAKDFDTKVDYYVLINYAAVRNLVNALSGVDITIKSPDKRGLYDPNINKHDGGPLRLTNGKHHLDGQTALNLTRARGDDYRAYGFPQADFDRTEHQRQVLAAIKDRLSYWLILNPLKNGKVAQALAKNIKTDIKAKQARPLFGLYNSVPQDKMLSIGLRDVAGQNLLASYNAGGLSALIPAAGLENYSQIQRLIKQLNSGTLRFK